MDDIARDVFQKAYDDALEGKGVVELDGHTVIQVSNLLKTYHIALEKMKKNYDRDMHLVESELSMLKIDYEDLYHVYRDLVDSISETTTIETFRSDD